jgi:hypothetical protein
LAKMGGPMAEVAKAMNKSPSREQQAKLLEEANATSKNTKDVADSTGRGDQPGSFYTHDTTAEGLLGGILGVLRELTAGMLGVIPTVSALGACAVKCSGAPDANQTQLTPEILGVLKNIADSNDKMRSNSERTELVKARDAAKKELETRTRSSFSNSDWNPLNVFKLPQQKKLEEDEIVKLREKATLTESALNDFDKKDSGANIYGLPSKDVKKLLASMSPVGMAKEAGVKEGSPEIAKR